MSKSPTALTNLPRSNRTDGTVRDSDLKKVEELRTERLARLQNIFEKIEVRVRHELSLEQRRWVERHFGDYCPLYPAVWLLLVP